MHLACCQTWRTILLTGNTLGSNVRTRGAGGFLFGSELIELGLEGCELVLELGVLGDEGEDLHDWGVGFWVKGSYLGFIQQYNASDHSKRYKHLKFVW
jgi:hypothetical protein